MKLPVIGVKTRLTLWYAAAMAITVLAFSLAVYGVVRITLHRHVNRQLDQEASVLENLLRKDPKEFEDPHELVEIEDFGVIKLFEVSVDGQVLVGSEAWRHAGLGTALQRSADWTSVPWLSPNGRSYYLWVREATVRNRALRCAVAHEADFTTEALNNLSTALLLGFPFSVVLAVIGGYLIAGKVLSPVGTMASKAQEITADQLSERLPVEHPEDELGRLAISFNATLARLERSFSQLRRFTSDASHELRTPLTALRSVGEVGLQESTEPKQYREVIGSMLEEAHRLTSLVDTLLILARADSGHIKIQREPTDLCSLVQRVAGDLEVLAEEKGQTMTTEAKCGIVALVDPAILRHALINIVDNAIKHTQAGGRIQISISGDSKIALISVQDDGPGIAAEHLDNVFDRFFRVDRGRSSVNGGTGLGLAIAKWATEVNGGRLEVRSEEGRGCHFKMSISVA